MDPAVFFDGQSSRRHIVTLAFADRLEIAAADEPGGTTLACWPYEAMRRANGPAGALRLACTTAPPLARLELRDASAQADILRLCHALDGPGSAAAISVRRIAPPRSRLAPRSWRWSGSACRCSPISSRLSPPIRGRRCSAMR
jgi:hypothetical protein